MKTTEIRSKLNEIYELTEADDFKNNDDTTFEFKDLQELFKEKVLELDEAVDRLEDMEKEQPKLSTDQLTTLGSRIYATIEIMKLNAVANNSISFAKRKADKETYAMLASQLLDAQWHLFQHIQNELDDVSYILLNADELEQLV